MRWARRQTAPANLVFFALNWIPEAGYAAVRPPEVVGHRYKTGSHPLPFAYPTLAAFCFCQDIGTRQFSILGAELDTGGGLCCCSPARSCWSSIQNRQSSVTLRVPYLRCFLFLPKISFAPTAGLPRSHVPCQTSQPILCASMVAVRPALSPHFPVIADT